MAKRKHRATGNKPPGGARPGAGRPEGSKSPLPQGAVQAIEALRWQVPPEAPPSLGALADRAFQRVADVLEEKVHAANQASVLGAATRIREWVCGPAAQKHLVGTVPGEGPLTIEIKKYTTEGAPWPQTTTQQPPQSEKQPTPPTEEETPPQ